MHWSRYPVGNFDRLASRILQNLSRPFLLLIENDRSRGAMPSSAAERTAESKYHTPDPRPATFGNPAVRVRQPQMQITRLAVSVIISVGTIAGTSRMPTTAAVTVFPTVTGKNLDGKTIALPKDFTAPASIVYIAFVRDQQAQVDSWKPFVAETLRRHPTIGEYEVPTLSKGNALFRMFIDGGMRRGIPSTDARAHTVTLYIDKSPFEASLDIKSESAISVLLVQPDGTILWRATGAYDAAKNAGLEGALATVEKS
jgi:hypothetical protein